MNLLIEGMHFLDSIQRYVHHRNSCAINLGHLLGKKSHGDTLRGDKGKKGLSSRECYTQYLMKIYV